MPKYAGKTARCRIANWGRSRTLKESIEFIKVWGVFVINQQVPFIDRIEASNYLHGKPAFQVMCRSCLRVNIARRFYYHRVMNSR